jgi:phage repressor protein C with HTH and peptisase S24 domain
VIDRRLGVAVVSGRSMEPTLHEGDRVLVLWGGRPRPGRLAVVRLPPSDRGPRPVSVKRVTGTAPGEPGAWWVERDNPAEGVDSWQVGGIPDADVVGRVLLRLPAFTRPGWRA